jgi:hypothetical protein
VDLPLVRSGCWPVRTSTAFSVKSSDRTATIWLQENDYVANRLEVGGTQSAFAPGKVCKIKRAQDAGIRCGRRGHDGATAAPDRGATVKQTKKY